MLSRVSLFCLLATSPAIALAYIGPGAGISAIGSLLALLAAVLLAIVGFVWYPAKRFLKKRRERQVESNDHQGD